MAKKSKEKQKQKQSNDETLNKSNSIFSNLFGTNPTVDSNAASLFSDNNPFRRNTQEPKLSVIEASIENQPNGVVEIKDIEVKKTKKRDKNVILDSNGVVSDSGTKKKDKNVILDSNGVVSDSGSKKKDKNVILLGSESVVNEKGSLVYNEESNGEVNDSKMGKERKKKKRKRDEIEAEYEAKRYGVVDMEEGEKGVGEMVVVGEKRKKMDNPEDMMVTNEGFDDESKLLRTVFVGNLPLKIKKKALLKEFGSFGEVESVRIRSIPVADSATPRKAAIIKKKLNDNADSVHAYVVFKSEESAQASLAHNMAVVEGRHIRVDRACPPRKKMKGDNNGLYDNKRTIFVGNLPFDVKDEEIYQLFSGIKELESSIEAVRVIRDPNTLLGKGIAYAMFKTREAANFVCRKRNLKLRDRELRVSHAKANSTPSKRKSSSEDRFSSPAKKFAYSATPGGSDKGKAKAAVSYQGMKASKSGVQKKTQSKISHRRTSTPKTQISQKPIDRKAKRPSVAARKAKELKAAASGLKQFGTKRKLESRTPDSAGRKKKFRKS